jgi:DMSO/TMAO reductase YedYZ molybdopterin-dependent catalytic subunit
MCDACAFSRTYDELQFTGHDEGFWELRGYHIYGDPWREQRYTND